MMLTLCATMTYCWKKAGECSLLSDIIIIILIITTTTSVTMMQSNIFMIEIESLLCYMQSPLSDCESTYYPEHIFSQTCSKTPQLKKSCRKNHAKNHAKYLCQTLSQRCSIVTASVLLFLNNDNVKLVARLVIGTKFR